MNRVDHRLLIPSDMNAGTIVRCLWVFLVQEDSLDGRINPDGLAKLSRGEDTVVLDLQAVARIVILF